MKNPEIDPHKYGQMIFFEGTKVIKWRKESLINKWCWNKWIFMWGKKGASTLILFTKMNWRWGTN